MYRLLFLPIYACQFIRIAMHSLNMSFSGQNLSQFLLVIRANEWTSLFGNEVTTNFIVWKWGYYELRYLEMRLLRTWYFGNEVTTNLIFRKWGYYRHSQKVLFLRLSVNISIGCNGLFEKVSQMGKASWPYYLVRKSPLADTWGLSVLCRETDHDLLLLSVETTIQNH